MNTEELMQVEIQIFEQELADAAAKFSGFVTDTSVLDVKISAEDSPEERYDADHEYNGVNFRLDNFKPDDEESRILIFHVIEQSIRDYLLLYNSEFGNERLAWTTAAAFLFDDDYLMNWGTWELSPAELFDIVNVDIRFIREKVALQFKTKYEKRK